MPRTDKCDSDLDLAQSNHNRTGWEFVPAERQRQCSAARKVTVGLASRRPYVKTAAYPPTGSMTLETEMRTSPRPIRCRRSMQGSNHWGVGGSGPPKIWTDHPNFFDKECDYRYVSYVTYCSPRNWVYHPYFVLHNNLDQGIGPQL